MARFDLGRRVAIVDPFQPMGGDFPPRLVHRRNRFDIARHGGCDRVDGHRNRALGEHAVQSPEPGARAVFVERLHVHVTHARPRRRADDFRQESFGRRVAVQDVVLAALLVIDDELHGDARPVWPVGERGVTPVADHVARIVIAVRHLVLSPAPADDRSGTLRQDRRLLQPALQPSLRYLRRLDLRGAYRIRRAWRRASRGPPSFCARIHGGHQPETD